MASKVTSKVGGGNPATGSKDCSLNSSDVPKKQLHSAVAQANKIGKLLEKRISFDIDSETNKIIVKVIDINTGDVLRVLPPGEMLRIAAHLKQLKILNDKVIGAAESVIFDRNSDLTN